MHCASVIVHVFCCCDPSLIKTYMFWSKHLFCDFYHMLQLDIHICGPIPFIIHASLSCQFGPHLACVSFKRWTNFSGLICSVHFSTCVDNHPNSSRSIKGRTDIFLLTVPLISLFDIKEALNDSPVQNKIGELFFIIFHSKRCQMNRRIILMHHIFILQRKSFSFEICVRLLPYESSHILGVSCMLCQIKNLFGVQRKGVHNTLYCPSVYF